ncbi:hypothetical protein [Aureimonas mangrovi]|uniref:hypothetical protein n=1 Tax=Aureimonas mangrovi TaxID=2758041 RepID=UPI00163D6937|nr:hypothetical protein [Aureimonas mangrovi]
MSATKLSRSEAISRARAHAHEVAPVPVEEPLMPALSCIFILPIAPILIDIIADELRWTFSPYVWGAIILVALIIFIPLEMKRRTNERIYEIELKRLLKE